MKKKLAFCLVAALASSHASSQTAYSEIEDWTIARFFDDLDAPLRKDLLSPAIEPHGVNEARFHVCLDGLNTYPDTRRLRVAEAVKECIGYAKSRP